MNKMLKKIVKQVRRMHEMNKLNSSVLASKFSETELIKISETDWTLFNLNSKDYSLLEKTVKFTKGALHIKNTRNDKISNRRKNQKHSVLMKKTNYQIQADNVCEEKDDSVLFKQLYSESFGNQAFA